MANDSIKLFNFYRRYKWNKTDFADWQDGMVDHSRGMFEGLFGGAVMEGFAPSGTGSTGSGDFALTISAGIASGPTGYLNVINDPTWLEISAPSADFERALVVVRPDVQQETAISKPTDPSTTVYLNDAQKSAIEVLRGVVSNNPEYPSTEANDVVLCGLRLYSGQTSLGSDDIDLEPREVPGANSNFQQNFGKYDDRLRPYLSTYKVIGIKPSQLESPMPRAFSYVSKQTPSTFPKDSGGSYNGSAGDTFVDLETGAVTGADEATSNFTPTIPTAGNAIVACLSLSTTDELKLSYGTEGTRAQCIEGIKNQSGSGAGSVSITFGTKPIAFIIVESDDGSTVSQMDFIDCRSFVSVGEQGPTYETFTSDDSWDAPAGVTKVRVRLRQSTQLLQGGYSGTHVHAIATNGDVYAWGANTNGYYGDGSTTSSSSPVSIGSYRKFLMASDGDTHTALLDDHGDCWTSGLNTNGQLGDGTTTTRSNLVKVIGGHKFKKIHSSFDKSFGLTPGGELYGWGQGTEGQLGDNTTANKSSPVLVTGGKTWVDVTGNQLFTAAIDDSGAAYCWGYNANGQLGDNTSTSKSSPVAVVGGITFTKLRCGRNFVIGQDDSGNLHAWGENGSGTLGDGTTTDRSSPVAVQGLSGLTVIDFDAGENFAFALTDAGELYFWGTNGTQNHLGDGTTTSGTTYSTATSVSHAQTYKRLWVLDHTIWAMGDNDQLYVWGANTGGVYGNNSITSDSTPVESAVGLRIRQVDPEKFVDIEVTPGTTYAIKLDQFYAKVGDQVVGELAKELTLIYDV